jgi:Protein of unknown function (DUF1367)
MELYCQNTLTGLVPLYPSDQIEKRKLKLGNTYKCEITNPRNLGFHKKFMALINVGCENSKLNMPFDTYRRYMTIKAGFFKAYSTPKGIYYEAMSISFASMEQDEFEDVYSRVLDKIIEDIGVTKPEIEAQLINFI